MDHLSNSIDQIIKNAIDVMDSSKYQVFEICESARQEMGALKLELQSVMQEIDKTIEKVDQLEIDFRKSRMRLTEVSRDFKRFGEEDIKAAYESATNIQLEIMIYREKESNLRHRRNDLQTRIRKLDQTIERAEVVVSQMNVVLEYLSGDLNQVTRIIELAKNRQMLGLKIILAQEEERKRIAREIHDGLAQNLANVILRTEIAERMVGQQKDELVKEEIIDLKGQMRYNLEEVRKMIFNLRPMALDDLGFIPALRKFVQDFEEKHRIRTQFKLSGKEQRLPSAMEVAIYRIVQEAFSNIQKHANASHVILDVRIGDEHLDITIKDNGVGFVTNEFREVVSYDAKSDLQLNNAGQSIDFAEVELEDDNSTSHRNEDPDSRSDQYWTEETIAEAANVYRVGDGEHFGLVGMRERIELLEGELYIHSTPNEGTCIQMNIPIKVRSRME